MQAELPQNIKSECLYYVKNLADQCTFCEVLAFCSEDNKQLFRGQEGSSRPLPYLITRYIENIKRSPQAYQEELRVVSPYQAPVIAATHQYLQKRFPERFTASMSSSESSHPIDSPSSSSSSSSSFDGATPARDRTTARHSSSDKTAALSVGFAQLSVALHNKRSPPCKPATNKVLV
jgi:hypothetical protein